MVFKFSDNVLKLSKSEEERADELHRKSIIILKSLPLRMINSNTYDFEEVYDRNLRTEACFAL